MDDPLDRLQATIQSRRDTPTDNSYTTQLLSDGRARIAQKLGEEAVETVIAAMGDDAPNSAPHAADLLYHLLVLLTDAGLTIDDVRAELARREGVGGLVEKAAR